MSSNGNYTNSIEGSLFFTDPILTLLSETLVYYQSTDCFLRCTDTPTAVVNGQSYFAATVQITLTDTLIVPTAQFTFYDVLLSAISPGQTITIVLAEFCWLIFI